MFITFDFAIIYVNILYKHDKIEQSDEVEEEDQCN